MATITADNGHTDYANIMPKVQEIIDNEDGDTYLWLHDSGDCILWPTEADSIDDDGVNAIGRWQLNDEEMGQLEILSCVNHD